MWGCPLSTDLNWPWNNWKVPQVRVGKGKPLPYGCTQAKKGHGWPPQQMEPIGCTKKDTMITMEWLYPLSFPWLQQELTSAFWRQTPLYLGIFNSTTLDAFLKVSRNWSFLPDWMIGSNGFPTSKSQSRFFLLRQHGLSSKYHLPRSGASVCSRVW